MLFNVPEKAHKHMNFNEVIEDNKAGKPRQDLARLMCFSGMFFQELNSTVCSFELQHFSDKIT